MLGNIQYGCVHSNEHEKITLATDTKLTNKLAIMIQEKELILVVRKGKSNSFGGLLWKTMYYYITW